MDIRIGFEIGFGCQQPTPMVLMLRVHPTRADDLRSPDTITAAPPLAITEYRDGFGNICSRVVLPPGQTTLSANATIHDSGVPDPATPDARQNPVPDLPAEQLVFLLGSRYCETDELSNIAWQLFGQTPEGWPRVQAICDFVHRHITFDYMQARATRSAADAYWERVGVCRDFAHLAVAFCRCMNIPARYVTGYLGDSVCRPIRRRWISPRGSRCGSAIAGTSSTRATTGRGSAGCRLPSAAMPPTSPSAMPSAMPIS